jgi:hypothetical protein
VRSPVWALAALLAAGCVVIPIPRRDPTVAAAQWLAARDGAISREDVLLHLGEPDFAGDAEQVLIYRWHRLRALWFVGGSGGAAAGGVNKEHDLVLRFDPTGRLVSQEVAAGFEILPSKTVCTPSGICVENSTDDHFVYEANVEPHAESNGSACSVVFLPSSRSESDPASIWADGRLLGFASYQGWLGASLSPGPHRVVVMSPPSLRQVVKELSFSCDAGAQLYIVQQSTASFFGVFGDGPLALQGEPLPSELRSRTRRYLNVEPVPP